MYFAYNNKGLTQSVLWIGLTQNVLWQDDSKKKVLKF
jgi:hypothetical protein